MQNILSDIGRKLNGAHILWAIGASMLLNQFGLEDKPGDIDIIVALEDSTKADSILQSLGNKKPAISDYPYATDSFSQYEIRGIGIDLMAGLAIRHSEGVFNYHFERHSVTGMSIINEVVIPLTSLEDWYVLYQLMPGKQEKADRIRHYLESRGITHKSLLYKSLEGNLTREIRQSISVLLSQSTD